MSIRDFHNWAQQYQDKHNNQIKQTFGVQPKFNVTPNAHQTYGTGSESFTRKTIEFLEFGVKNEENDFIRDNLHFPDNQELNEYAGVVGALSPTTLAAIEPYRRGKRAGFEKGKEEGERVANRNYTGDVHPTRDVMKVSSAVARPGFMRASNTETKPVTSLEAEKSFKDTDPADAGKRAVKSQNQTAGTIAKAMSKKNRNPLSRYFS